MKELDEVLAEFPRGPLFHYTSHEGLLGILSTRKIWASKIQYLNDSAEFSYSLGLLSSRLAALSRDNKIDQAFADKVNWYIQSIRHVNIFIASFTEDGDLLSQWRAYCPPEGGYSIGFAYFQIMPSLTVQCFNLLKCIYEIDLQTILMDQSLIDVHSEYVTSGGEHLPDLHKLLTMACSFKHPAFSEEKEWRAISALSMFGCDPISFRAGKSLIVPYYALRLASPEGEFGIDRIIVGPTPHPELSSESVHSVLVNTLGPLHHVTILNSSIPYRNW